VTLNFIFGSLVCFYSMGSYNSSVELVDYSIVHLGRVTFLALLQMCLPGNILSFVADVLAWEPLTGFLY
jgi:hypothetical protein